MFMASVHEGKKRFKCGICNYISYIKNMLNQFMREKSLLNSTFFSKKGVMDTHVETVHEGKKPFEFPICDYSCY